MLAEIAITPKCFNYGTQEQNLEWVSELERALLPRNGDAPVVVCDLRNGGWCQEVSKSIAMIANTSQRGRAQSLLTKLHNDLMIVLRDSFLEDCPCDESMWIAEAVASSSILPIELVFTTLRESAISCLHPANIGSEEIDRLVDSKRNIARDLPSQVTPLRNLLWHSEWAIARFPQIRGGDDDEIQTVKQIADLLGRPERNRPSAARCELEVQLNPEALKKNSFDSVVQLIHEWSFHGLTVKVNVAKEKFSNRELLAGDFSESGSKCLKRARWFLTMQHVALKRSDSSKENNTWSFFGRKRAHERLGELSKQGAADLPRSVRISK